VAAPAADVPAYAQVREIGLARVLTFRSEERHAVSVDLENRSSTPASLDLGATHLEIAAADGSKRSVLRVAASGPGGLPGRVDLSPQPRPPVTLRPRRGTTLWLVFDAIEEVPVRSRITLRLALVNARAPLTVVLHDSTNASPLPRWDFSRWNDSATTLTWRLMFQGYGSDRAESIHPLWLGLWHSRRWLQMGLGAGVSSVYEHEQGLIRGALGYTLEASLGWRPPAWLPGIFAAGQLSHLSFRESDSPDRWSPAAVVGLEVPLNFSISPLAFVRIGYVHELDSRTPQRGGFSLSIDIRSWRW
jgi:hypothetical protein